MSISTKKTYILAAVATGVYGDDDPLTGTSAILVKNVTGEPFDGEAIDRGLVKPFLGASPKTHVAVHRKISFEVEIAGSGTPGTLPGYDPLLRGCGFAAVVTPGADVVYTPISDGFEAITLYYYRGSQLRKMTGARGTVSLSLAEKAIPVYKFEFTGLWSPPLDSAAPAPSYGKFQDPVALSYLDTQFTIYGEKPPLKSLEITLGNETPYTDRPNQREVAITDRQAGGSIEMEWPELSVFDIEMAAKNNLTSPLSMTHGTKPGHIVEIACPRAQITAPKFSEDQNKLMCRADLSLVPSDAGNDELTITLK